MDKRTCVIQQIEHKDEKDKTKVIELYLKGFTTGIGFVFTTDIDLAHQFTSDELADNMIERIQVHHTKMSLIKVIR